MANDEQRLGPAPGRPRGFCKIHVNSLRCLANFMEANDRMEARFTAPAAMTCDRSDRPGGGGANVVKRFKIGNRRRHRRFVGAMHRYSLVFLDRFDRILDDRTLRARDVGHAMAQANRRLCSSFRQRDDGRLDPRGRVDVRDPQGTMVARIYCAETIAAMS